MATQTTPNIWAGGSYGRGYGQRMYNLNPSAWNYKNGYVTINDNPIYQAQNVNGKAMINETDLPAFQKAIDTYAQNTGFTTPNYNPNTDNTYQMYKQANDAAATQVQNRTTRSTLAALSGAYNNGMPSSWSVGAAGQAGAAAAQPYYQNNIDMLPQMEQLYYNRQNANREYNANQAQQAFNNSIAESGLTGLYKGKETADQAYRNKTYALDERQTNASIANANADNARSWYALNQKTAENDPLATANEDQVFWYNEILKQLYGTGENQNKYVDSALLRLQQNEAGYRQLLGDNLYKYMLERATATASKLPSYKESTTKPTQSQQKYSNEAKLQSILDSQSNPLQWAQSNKNNIVNEFGLSYYNSLIENLQ